MEDGQGLALHWACDPSGGRFAPLSAGLRFWGLPQALSAEGSRWKSDGVTLNFALNSRENWA